jgi:hypothetical protein
VAALAQRGKMFTWISNPRMRMAMMMMMMMAMTMTIIIMIAGIATMAVDFVGGDDIAAPSADAGSSRRK